MNNIEYIHKWNC